MDVRDRTGTGDGQHRRGDDIAESNRYFFTYSGYTQPSTLYLAASDGAVREVCRMPAMFDADGLVVEQHEATSKDGTRIPYFIVHREAWPTHEPDAALRVRTPGYNSVTGAAWLERGSNGGRLVGVAFTQRSDLFDAVVVQVPLLDMKRYNKLLAGATWMAEYGNPDIPEEWAYISRYSP